MYVTTREIIYQKRLKSFIQLLLACAKNGDYDERLTFTGE